MTTHDVNSAAALTPITASTHDRVTGVDIRIDRAGSGAPIVILNGLLGLNEHWFPLLPTLAKRNQVFLIQPPLLEMKGPGCTVDGVTRLIAGVLETLIDRPALVVGNSLGGHVALKLALEGHPLVRALALVGSSGLFERGFEKGVEHSPSQGWLEKKIGDLFFDRSRMIPGMVAAAHAELSRRSAARALVKLGRSAKNDHLGERIAGLTTPTLLAWGRNDVVTPPEVAEEFHALLPNSRLVWLDRCGHAPQIERPDELAAAISQYAAVLDGSGACSAGAA